MCCSTYSLLRRLLFIYMFLALPLLVPNMHPGPLHGLSNDHMSVLSGGKRGKWFIFAKIRLCQQPPTCIFYRLRRPSVFGGVQIGDIGEYFTSFRRGGGKVSS